LAQTFVESLGAAGYARAGGAEKRWAGGVENLYAHREPARWRGIEVGDLRVSARQRSSQCSVKLVIISRASSHFFTLGTVGPLDRLSKTATTPVFIYGAEAILEPTVMGSFFSERTGFSILLGTRRNYDSHTEFITERGASVTR